jgi:hypothetical protein
VPFDSAVIRPAAPSLHSATNSDARNPDAENKKQNINQIFFPSRDDAERGSFATSSGQTLSITVRTSSDTTSITAVSKTKR